MMSAFWDYNGQHSVGLETAFATKSDTPTHKGVLVQATGQFHVKGPRKKVNVEKWIFFNEMWKIIGQIDDFDRFLNYSCNLGVF